MKGAMRSGVVVLVMMIVAALVSGCSDGPTTTQLQPEPAGGDPRDAVSPAMRLLSPPSVTSMSTVTSVSGKRVLLYHSDFTSVPGSLKSALVNTGLFLSTDIDIQPMTFPALSLAVMSAYDCVIAWTNHAPSDPVGQGNRLKEYADAGGGVVLAVYGYSSPTDPWELQGGITLPGYSPLDITTVRQVSFPRSLNFGTALTADPILGGVADFTYFGNNNYVDVTLDPGATLIGVDNFGVPVLAANAARNVAGINLWPGFSHSAGVDRAIANACISTADQTSPNQAPVANPGDGYIGDEGSAVAFDGSGSSDPDGDALTYDWDFGDGNTGTGVSPTHTYGDNGFYTVTLTVDDGKGGTSTVQTGAKIANVNPDLGALSVPGAPLALVSGGTVVTVSGAYTDPGTLDTHTGSLACDGGTAGAVTAAAGNASGTCTFTAAGVYTVSMTVTDDDGGSDTETASSYIVVYDPSAGFVTGGGWIHSAAGSYADDVTLEGKATFGFVSKYQKGASTPVGNTEFQFHAGSFAFKSSSYQWLVIAGARAQYKGEGQVMGRAGTYGFLVTAIDGAVSGGGGVDKFRIKVWDVVTGAIVYDNRMGDAEDSAAATALGGGSIVIHAK